MSLPKDGCLLRVFVGESSRAGGTAVYESIVQKARELKLAGATVLRGVMGFGANSRLHAAHFLSLSDDLPVVIEIVDTRERVESLLPFIESVVHDGMVTLEQVEIHFYRANTQEQSQ